MISLQFIKFLWNFRKGLPSQFSQPAFGGNLHPSLYSKGAKNNIAKCVYLLGGVKKMFKNKNVFLAAYYVHCSAAYSTVYLSNQIYLGDRICQTYRSLNALSVFCSVG